MEKHVLELKDVSVTAKTKSGMSTIDVYKRQIEMFDAGHFK